MEKEWKNSLLNLSIIALMIFSFWLGRYYLFSLHGMKSFPRFLGILSFLGVFLSLAYDKKILGAFIPLGYALGLLFGNVFQKYIIDPGGGKLSNYWVVWLLTYILLIIIGITGEKINIKED